MFLLFIYLFIYLILFVCGGCFGLVKCVFFCFVLFWRDGYSLNMKSLKQTTTKAFASEL